eukprot:Nk52_evm8s367 gene=Nk52_evmTU8s367
MSSGHKRGVSSSFSRTSLEEQNSDGDTKAITIRVEYDKHSHHDLIGAEEGTGGGEEGNKSGGWTCMRISIIVIVVVCVIALGLGLGLGLGLDDDSDSGGGGQSGQSSNNGTNTTACPNDCGEHGTCWVNTGNCTCHGSWSGEACQVPPSCSQKCLDNVHGQCDASTGECKCLYGYTGTDCTEKPECAHTKDGLECNSPHGRCRTFSDPDNPAKNYTKCECFKNYKGDACQTPPCPMVNGKVCSQHGICGENTDYVCQCDTNTYGNVTYAGQKCSCPSYKGRICSGEDVGTCNETSGGCTCKEPSKRFGDACENLRCPVDPHSNKECNKAEAGWCDYTTGKCQCWENWTGPSCSARACDRMCLNHGTCDETGTKCICKGLWEGDDCSVKKKLKCPSVDPSKECSGNGTCDTDTGMCTCKAGLKKEEYNYMCYYDYSNKN